MGRGYKSETRSLASSALLTSQKEQQFSKAQDSGKSPTGLLYRSITSNEAATPKPICQK